MCRGKAFAAGFGSQQFPIQPGQCLAIVDIKPGWQRIHGKIDLLSPLQRLLRNDRRAPGDVLKESRMQRIHANEVVPAVVGWT